ncbi:hypothetical protein [Rhizobium leguminosarum]|uniref:hypothetical protein n=1 Tax=Rhizobium leguminosarum TaxID=384 RepID=UPI003F9A2B93
MHAAIIERFPDWAVAAQRTQRPAIDWVALGSEYDIGHIIRLWQRVMRFHVEQIPDDESVMWQLADKLQGRRSHIVKIQEAIISIDRRHMADFRAGMDYLWDYLCEEHADDLYEAHGTQDEPEWIRLETATPPITTLEDSQRAHDVIKALYGGWVSNVVVLRDDARWHPASRNLLILSPSPNLLQRSRPSITSRLLSRWPGRHRRPVTRSHSGCRTEGADGGRSPDRQLRCREEGGAPVRRRYRRAVRGRAAAPVAVSE